MPSLTDDKGASSSTSITHKDGLASSVRLRSVDFGTVETQETRDRDTRPLSEIQHQLTSGLRKNRYDAPSERSFHVLKLIHVVTTARLPSTLLPTYYRHSILLYVNFGLRGLTLALWPSQIPTCTSVLWRSSSTRDCQKQPGS